jgi:WD40 repeat protein
MTRSGNTFMMWLRLTAILLLLGGTASAGDARFVAQEGHDERIVCAAFSPDGRLLISGSRDGTARVWEGESGRERRRLGDHDDVITAVTLSGDGRWAVTGDRGAVAHIWDVTTGRETRRLLGHEWTAEIVLARNVYAEPGEVTSVAVSPDGRYVLTGSNDQTARLWDPKTGQEVRLFEGHDLRVYAVAFTPDGRSVLAAGQDGTVRMWDRESDREVRRCALRHVDGEGLRILTAAISPDGLWIASGCADGTAHLWEARTGRLMARFFGGDEAIESVGFSKDAECVLTGSFEGVVRIWRVADGKEIGTWYGERVVAFSRDGRLAATGGETGVVTLRDVGSGRIVRRLAGAAPGVGDLALSNDDRRLLVGLSDGGVAVWDLESGRPILRESGHALAVSAAAFSGKGRVIVTGSVDGTIRVMDLKGEEDTRTLDTREDTVLSVAVSPDARLLLTASEWGAHLRDATTGASIRRYPIARSGASAVAFSRNGRLALIGSGERTTIFDVVSGDELRGFGGHFEEVRSVSFSAETDRVITSGDDGTVRVWNAASGTCSHRLEGNGDPISDAALSADGTRLVAACDDRTIRVWRMPGGREIHRIATGNRPVRHLAISSNGRWLFTGDGGPCVRLLDLSTGREAATIGHVRGDSWIVTDREGRFDGADDCGAGYHWTVQGEVVTLDRLAPHYRVPGLLAQVLGHRDEPLPAVVAVTKLGLPPTIDAEVVGRRIKLRFVNRGGGIGPVAVFLGGARFVDDARPAGMTPEMESLEIEVDSGESSGRVEVRAFEWHGSLFESKVIPE